MGLISGTDRVGCTTFTAAGQPRSFLSCSVGQGLKLRIRCAKKIIRYLQFNRDVVRVVHPFAAGTPSYYLTHCRASAG